jgi:flavin reductase (DIM6/NTAB) family NADH-FMN oxidoreductase RutF
MMESLRSRGLLLTAYDAAGKANSMTIGWGTLGSIWGMPLWIVLVRPSRYTFECIERTGAFSVNVPTAAMDRACSICGSRSGRDGDKLADAGLTAEPGTAAECPTLAECPIVYECEVVHRNDVLPAELFPAIQQGNYASGDYHRIYYGRVRAAAAAEINPAELIG